MMVPMSSRALRGPDRAFQTGRHRRLHRPVDGDKKGRSLCWHRQPRAFIGPQKARALRKLNKAVDTIPIQILVELGGTGATFTGCAGCLASLCCVGRGALSFRSMMRDLEGDDDICDVDADDVALITFATGSSASQGHHAHPRHPDVAAGVPPQRFVPAQRRRSRDVPHVCAQQHGLGFRQSFLLST